MKPLKILAIILFCVSAVHAQNGAKGVIDENTIVKDTSGQKYSYDIWKKLLGTGYYVLKQINKGNPQEGFYIVRISEEEKLKKEQNAPKPKESAYFTTGLDIANFKERDIDGVKWNLKNLKGKIVVLNFWFINCPPCRQEMPSLNAVVESYKNDSSVVFLSFCLDEAYLIKDFLKQSPFKYKIIDNAKYICDSYGVKLYPTHVVLDQEGKVQYHTSGLSSGTIPWLKKTLEQLKKDK